MCSCIENNRLIKDPKPVEEEKQTEIAESKETNETKEPAEPEQPEKKNKAEEVKTGIDTQEPAKKSNMQILPEEYLKSVDMRTFLMRYNSRHPNLTNLALIIAI